MNEIIPAWLKLSPDVSIRWGITLLHFLWQGAVIGLLALVAVRLLRSQSASVRYWLNAVALMACPMCVAWTFAIVEVPESWRVSSNQQSHGSLDSGWIPIETSSADNLVDIPYPKLDPPQVVSNADAASASFDAASRTPATAPVAIETKTSSASEWMPIVARWIAVLYAVGVVCFLVRLAIALWGGHRLRAISTPVSDSTLLELIRTQAHRIGLKLVPVVAYCERVAVPTVIGVLRPMILLPATLTTGLTTDELSAILSHELAHIRRYDLWMNLLQRIIESLLFFHPVVWLLSHRLSAEREICCDDLVIRSGHQPMNYAGALLRMAELCAGISLQNAVSLAATSGGTNLLVHRVLRLIHQSPSTRLSLGRKGLLVLVGSLILLTAIVEPSTRLVFCDESNQATAVIAADEQSAKSPDRPSENNRVPKAASMSVEEGGTLDRETDPKVETIRFKVIDENGLPASGVSVFFNCARVKGSDPMIVNGEHETDAEGVVVVPVDNPVHIFRLWFSAPGLVTLFVHWEEGEANLIPSEYELIMQKSTELGGRIIDANGVPMNGANVGVRIDGGKHEGMKKFSEIADIYRFGKDAAVCDADGRWVVQGVPTGDHLTVRLQFADADKKRFTQFMEISEYGITLESLRAKSATWVLGTQQIPKRRFDADVAFGDFEIRRYPHCVPNNNNLISRPLVDAIAAFNQTSKESPTGVLQRPITEQETRDAVAKFAAESHVPEEVRTQLEQILKSGELPANAYFRRFTRFDDGKQMQDVWWVRLVVETGTGPVYSVPVRTTSLSARPYTQMERQQNAADGLTLINRVASYYEEPPIVVQPSELPAASVETLIKRTQDAIKAEDDAAIGSLFESTGASETQRVFAVSELKAFSKARVHSIRVNSLKRKGELRTWSAWQYFKPNLPVVGFLEIEYEDNDAATRRADAQPLAGDRKILSLELGLLGDELRLVNYVPDGERTPPESLNPGPSITGHLEPLADGTHLVTDIITNPGSLLSAHLANGEIRLRDFQK